MAEGGFRFTVLGLQAQASLSGKIECSFRQILM